MVNNILLLVPIAEKSAHCRIKRSALEELKSFIIKTIEINLSAITGHIKITDYHHQTTANSNRGDIAIGISSHQAIKSEFSDNAITIDTIEWDEFTAEKICWINKNYDLLVLGGGGYIFLDSDGNLNHRAKDIEILERLTLPIIAYGIGLNRLMHEKTYNITDIRTLPLATKNYIKRFCSRIDIISVRDKPSKHLLETFSSRLIYITGDPVLFYTSPNRNNSYIPDSETHVGINLAAHGWRSIKILQEVMPIFEETYRMLNLDYSLKLKYFVHDDLEYSVINYLKRRGINFATVDGTTDLMLENYRRLSYVLNQMLHSSIFAFNAGIPSINIAYDLKSIAFFELFKLERFCLPWTEATFMKLKRLIIEVNESNDEIRNTISKTKKDLDAARREYFSAVKKLHIDTAND